MSDVHIFAIDLAKRSFQICAAAPGGTVLFNRTVSRAKLEGRLREQAPCIVAMETCATSHFWGRFAQALGHDVRLIPPIYVKPFVRRQKNDAAHRGPAGRAISSRMRSAPIPFTVQPSNFSDEVRTIAWR